MLDIKCKNDQMFAVVKTGGKQYPVKLGNVIKVEKLDGSIGTIVTLNSIIFANDNGTILDNKKVKVKAEVLEQTRGEKIIIFKKRRRKNYRRKNGHRQFITVLKVIGIDNYGN